MSLIGRAGRMLVELRHHRRFDRMPGTYRGVYGSFAEARASIPGRKVGFDHPELANLYDHRMDRVFPSDYPVLFWLREALPGCSSLFDFGGHVGVSFYAYRKYLELPHGFRWRVCDVPEIAKAGRELAMAKAEPGVTFCSSVKEADGFDVFLAAGSLQYLETPLSEMLAGLAAKPRHVIVNKLPLYDGAPFVTLQNTVHSYNPYCVANRAAFEQSIGSLGYEIIDRWENADVSCYIPMRPKHSIHAYSGIYFRARG